MSLPAPSIDRSRPFSQSLLTELGADDTTRSVIATKAQTGKLAVPYQTFQVIPDRGAYAQVKNGDCIFCGSKLCGEKLCNRMSERYGLEVWNIELLLGILNVVGVFSMVSSVLAIRINLASVHISLRKMALPNPLRHRKQL